MHSSIRGAIYRAAPLLKNNPYISSALISHREQQINTIYLPRIKSFLYLSKTQPLIRQLNPTMRYAPTRRVMEAFGYAAPIYEAEIQTKGPSNKSVALSRYTLEKNILNILWIGVFEGCTGKGLSHLCSQLPTLHALSAGCTIKSNHKWGSVEAYHALGRTPTLLSSRAAYLDEKLKIRIKKKICAIDPRSVGDSYDQHQTFFHPRAGAGLEYASHPESLCNDRRYTDRVEQQIFSGQADSDEIDKGHYSDRLLSLPYFLREL